MKFKIEDVRVDTYSGGGPRSCSMRNSLDMIKITHVPTGITETAEGKRARSSEFKKEMLEKIKQQVEEIEDRNIYKGIG